MTQQQPTDAQADDTELWRRALAMIPGGVNSPVRAFRAVGGTPLFIDRAKGPYVWDHRGKRYVDCVGAWGPMILGHGHPSIVDAVSSAAAKGVAFGASTAAEVNFAEMLIRHVPSLEKVRLVNSGTEACMSALRAARGFTKRNKIVKIAGGYHGHADCLLVRAGSGAETLGIPDSAGVPQGATQDTLILPYNDFQAAAALFERHGSEIAALIIEPVAGNMGTVAPKDGYLAALYEITRKTQSLLIFDEVMSGFRVALGGAQQRYGVKPDMTCLGKIIGGGLPVGAYGGRSDVMDCVAPEGPVYQAGTLSGNPLAVAAGKATINALATDDRLYAHLDSIGAHIEGFALDCAKQLGIDITVNRIGSMLTVFFCRGPVHDLVSAQASDLDRFAAFHRALLDQGVFWPPSQFEAAFFSLSHDEDALSTLTAAIQQAFSSLC